MFLPTSAIMYASAQPGCCDPAQAFENTTSTGGGTIPDNSSTLHTTSTLSNNTGNGQQQVQNHSPLFNLQMILQD